MLLPEVDRHAYRVFDIEKDIIVLAINVKCDEFTFPAHQLHTTAFPSQVKSKSSGVTSDSPRPTDCSLALRTPKDPFQVLMDSTNQLLDILDETAFYSATSLRDDQLLEYTLFDDTPFTYRDAMKSVDSHKWMKAMEEEMASRRANQTWVLADLPFLKRAIQCRWVYKLKADGTYKARLVVKGFRQKGGIDFHETFSPVVRYESAKLFVAFAAIDYRQIHQIDVKTAFLYGDLNEELYMRQPEGFEDKNHPDKVCRLQKSIYGLKQAPLYWNDKISEHLHYLGFKRALSDFGLYFMDDIMIALYVDDFLISSRFPEKIQWVKDSILKKFEIKDLGLATKFLNINIHQHRGGITLSLFDYISDVLESLKLSERNPNKLPCLPSEFDQLFDMERNKATLLDEQKLNLYQSIIGKLHFAATTTRFDISHIVGVLSRFTRAPSEVHLGAPKRVVKYLKGTQNYGLVFNRDSTLKVYCDSDWASEKGDRKSISGYNVTFGGAPAVWRS